MEAIRLKNSCLFKSCVGILCLNHSVMIMSLVCIVVFWTICSCEMWGYITKNEKLKRHVHIHKINSFILQLETRHTPWSVALYIEMLSRDSSLQLGSNFTLRRVFPVLSRKKCRVVAVKEFVHVSSVNKVEMDRKNSLRY